MATTDITEDILTKWRKELFEEMGFSSGDATLLSVGRDKGHLIDTHKTRKMIEAGCSHELAILILL